MERKQREQKDNFTMRDLMAFVRFHKGTQCKPHSKLKKAELLKLAIDNWGWDYEYLPNGNNYDDVKDFYKPKRKYVKKTPKKKAPKKKPAKKKPAKKKAPKKK